MTALSTARPASTRATSHRFAGFRPLVRKDTTEWFRGFRAPVIVIVVSLFMVLAAANAAINAFIAERLPADIPPPVVPSLAPLDNFGMAIGTQVFILAAILAVAGLMAKERESGTLAWVASKPVSRTSIWLAKWSSASVMLAVTAVVVPIAATVATIVVLYGAPDPFAVAAITAGAVALVVFYAALGLAIATVLPGVVPVVAVSFAVFALWPLVGGIVPSIAPAMPMAIFEWFVGIASGAPVGFVTPVAWAIGTALLVIGATRRMRSIEL
jgi:ABC-2 type transport system permease protein